MENVRFVIILILDVQKDLILLKEPISQKRMVQSQKSSEWTPRPKFGNEHPINL